MHTNQLEQQIKQAIVAYNDKTNSEQNTGIDELELFNVGIDAEMEDFENKILARGAYVKKDKGYPEIIIK